MSRSEQRLPPSAKSAERSQATTPAWQPAQNLAARGLGTPMDVPLRAAMESRFGSDFGAVRIHANTSAAESARSIGAAAYTTGRDIVFAAGRYQPQNAAGQQLLAHELAHVVQQSQTGTCADAEARADAAAEQVAQGGHVLPGALGGAPVALQAKPDDAAAAGDGTVFPRQTLAGFALNGAALTSAHSANIDRLAWTISLHLGLRRNGRAAIAIVGHTDRSGDEKSNMALGQQRADAARQALVDALKKQGVGEDKFGSIATRSEGESKPAVPTADGVKNEKNRRVEISVTIGSQPAAAPAKPVFDPLAPQPPSVLQPETPPGPRRDPGGDDLWKRMEENRKKIEEFDRKHPPTNKSLSEAVIDKVMETAIDPLIRNLPVSKELRDLARSGVRKGLEKGSEAACDAAIDAAGAKGGEAEAAKAACKAALETKPGGEGGTQP